MFKRFYPDMYIDSAYDIDYKGLYDKGYRGIIFDEVGSKYVSKADKPSPKNYIKAMEYMNTDTDNTYFVGDQLFTDVWGANRAGIMSILVKPIDKHEEIQIILKRRLEWIVLFFYKRQKHKYIKVKR